MSIGKYISVVLTAFFFVAIAVWDEEGISIWLFTTLVTGIGYAIGKGIYTSGKAKIYVSVVGDNKGAVRKAEVSVLLDDMEFCRGITDKKGKCTFYLPAGRGYGFKAKKGGYESVEKTLHVSDKSLRGISLELTSREVSVNVSGEHRPIKDAHVSARASTVSGTMTQHTDVDGECTFTLPLGDSCELIIEKDGYAPAKVQLGEDDTAASIKLEPKFVTVKVKVVDEQEQFIGDASVKIGKKSFVTDESGAVDAKMRVGTQELCVEKADFLAFTSSLDLSKDIERRVVLVRQQGWLEVSVVDAVSGEILSAKVTLLLFGSTSVEGKREEEERVHFDGVPVGAHNVRTVAEGYRKNETKVDILEGKNVLELQLEPLPALDDMLEHELVKVEEGLRTAVIKLSQSYDVMIPRYYQSYCLTLVQFARRLPQGANIAPEMMVESVKDVCREMVNIIEEKKRFYATTSTKEGETVEFSTRESDFYDVFKELIKDAGSFYNEHSNRIPERIKEVDRKITENMGEYDISLVTSLWKLAKKLAGMREDVAKNAICLLFAEIVLDFAERMFVVEEVAERLKK
jgi:hypothetical protein